jgi:hypothetical protein
MTKYSAFLVLLLASILPLHAQKLTITRIDLSKEKVIVYYALEDTNPNHNYKVSLYSSKDNFVAPLVKVTGDVGPEVKPGAVRRIEWNVNQELGEFKGTISVEVRAGVFVPFVSLNAFNAKIKYKRGKTYPLLWTSGNMGGQIDIDLYYGQNRVDTDRGVPNSGKYEYSIPGGVRPGSNYRLRFTNTRNRDEFIDSPSFSIVPKYPTALKAGGLLLIAGGVWFIINNIEPPPPPGTEIEEWEKGLPPNN